MPSDTTKAMETSQTASGGAACGRDMVGRGCLVRTRADADLVVDPGRCRAALESGAQVVSNENQPGEPDPVTGYRCEFRDDTTARVRPAD